MFGDEYTEVIKKVDLSPKQLELLKKTNQAVTEILKEKGICDRALLYGRYDMVELDDGSAAILECELFDPSL